jgi:hypothetical protein
LGATGAGGGAWTPSQPAMKKTDTTSATLEIAA